MKKHRLFLGIGKIGFVATMAVASGCEELSVYNKNGQSACAKNELKYALEQCSEDLRWRVFNEIASYQYALSHKDSASVRLKMVHDADSIANDWIAKGVGFDSIDAIFKKHNMINGGYYDPLGYWGLKYPEDGDETSENDIKKAKLNAAFNLVRGAKIRNYIDGKFPGLNPRFISNSCPREEGYVNSGGFNINEEDYSAIRCNEERFNEYIDEYGCGCNPNK